MYQGFRLHVTHVTFGTCQLRKVTCRLICSNRAENRRRGRKEGEKKKKRKRKRKGGELHRIWIWQFNCQFLGNGSLDSRAQTLPASFTASRYHITSMSGRSKAPVLSQLSLNFRSVGPSCALPGCDNAATRVCQTCAPPKHMCKRCATTHDGLMAGHKARTLTTSEVGFSRIVLCCTACSVRLHFI